MTIHARSDVMGIALSRSHGGCGQHHGRPVVNGAPVKEWAFDECSTCESAIRAINDPLWAAMPSEVPETPDEEKVRLDQEKRGQRDAVNAQAQALQQIANLPEGLATAFAQAFATAFAQMQATGSPLTQPLAPSAAVKVTCPDGHENLVSAKFCGECGQSVMPPLDATADELTITDTVIVLPPGDVLESMSMADLKKLAGEVGARTTNSREKQIALIREAQQDAEN